MAIEVDSEIYVNKLCKCRKCKTERLATFSFDFYPCNEVDSNGKHYLICEHCMMKLAFSKEDKPNNGLA